MYSAMDNIAAALKAADDDNSRRATVQAKLAAVSNMGQNSNGITGDPDFDNMLAQRQAEQDAAEAASAPSPAPSAVARRLGVPQGGGGVSSGHTADHYHAGVGIPGGKLTTINEGGQKWTVAAGAANAFKGLLDELNRMGYRTQSSGGYVDRDVRGHPGVKSEHAYGRAIDINAALNPMGSKLITNMPKNISQIAAKYGLVWGGDFHSRKDPMHFEYDR